ncbi:MAG: periplasmic heavy metal sensor [Thermoanaerobaculia bacterium]
MKTRALILTALTLLFVTTASAQQLPPGRWWRVPKIVDTLGLSQDQQNRLEAIFRTAASDLIDRKAEVEKQNIVLRGELDQQQLDRQAIRAAGAKLNDARSRLFERELMMLVDMRGVLSDAQWTRLRSELDRAKTEKPQPMRRRQ